MSMKMNMKCDNLIVQNKDENCQATDEVTEIENDENKNVSENVSSLGIIALQYEDSGEETESDVNKSKNQNTVSTIEAPKLQQYRSNIGESSSEESDSEEDSSTSSSTNSSDSPFLVSDNNSDSDDNSDSGKKRKEQGSNINIAKQKQIESELDNLPPIEDLKISVPETSCELCGEVAWTVEQLVVVKPKSGVPALNLDTVLFLDKGQRTLGKIFDVFGSVSEPHYCVRFNSSEHIQENEVRMGMLVYYCPNTTYTSLIFVHELMKMKGCDVAGDGSGGEPPDFSDDEEEQAYYAKQEQEKNNGNNLDAKPSKRRRMSNPAQNTNTRSRNTPSSGWQSDHPWNRNNQFRECNNASWGGSNPAQSGMYTHWAQYRSDAAYPCNSTNAYLTYDGRPYGGYGTAYNAAQNSYAHPQFFPNMPSRFNSVLPPSPPIFRHPGARFPRMAMPSSSRLFMPMYADTSRPFATLSLTPPPPPPACSTNDTVNPFCFK